MISSLVFPSLDRNFLGLTVGTFGRHGRVTIRDKAGKY